MNHQPQDSRRRAARNFVNALDELETVLQSDKSEPTETSHPSSARHRKSKQLPPEKRRETAGHDADFGQLLDDAVQDIEQFMAAEDEPPQSGR